MKKLLIILLIILLLGAGFLIAGHFAGLFSVSVDLTGKTKTYDIPSDTHTLEIHLGMAELTILEGDTFKVETNHKKVTVVSAGQALVITENDVNITLAVAKLPYVYVYLPKDTAFDSVNIQTGVGKMTIDTIDTKILKMELGAGSTEISTLKASERATISGSAGKIEVKNGELNNLKTDLTAGGTTIKSKLTGVSVLNCGAGNLTLGLVGSKEDYTLNITENVGQATLDGAEVNNTETYGSGESVVNVNGGVGAITVKYV